MSLAERLARSATRDPSFVDAQCQGAALQEIFRAVRDLDDEWLYTRVCMNLARRLSAASTVAEMRAMLTIQENSGAAVADAEAERVSAQLFQHGAAMN